MCSHCFLRCDPFLDLNIIKKSYDWKRFYFWEMFDLWYLKFLFFKLSFKILRLWKKNSSWNLEFKIWNFESLEFFKIKAWNLDHEIWSLSFYWKLKSWIQNLGIENMNLGKKIWVENLRFGIFENFIKKEIFFFGLTEFKCGGWNFGPPLFVSLLFFLLASSFFISPPPLSLFTLFFPLDFSCSFHHFFSQKILF